HSPPLSLAPVDKWDASLATDGRTLPRFRNPPRKAGIRQSSHPKAPLLKQKGHFAPVPRKKTEESIKKRSNKRFSLELTSQWAYSRGQQPFWSVTRYVAPSVVVTSKASDQVLSNSLNSK